MGKNIPVPCLDVIMIAFFWFSIRNMVFHCIFLGKRRSLLHQNTAQGSFFHLQFYSKKTLSKNVRKSARKYKRNVLIPPGLPIILLKSNEFNMAAVSVKRAISTPNSPWRASLFSRRYTIIQASFGSVF